MGCVSDGQTSQHPTRDVRHPQSSISLRFLLKERRAVLFTLRLAPQTCSEVDGDYVCQRVRVARVDGSCRASTNALIEHFFQLGLMGKVLPSLRLACLTAEEVSLVLHRLITSVFAAC